jgi:membrane protease YdiL (CAAX protease family)
LIYDTNEVHNLMASEPVLNRSFFGSIFLSAGESRLRAGWRILIQAGLMVVLASMLGVLIVLLALFDAIAYATIELLALFTTALAITLSIWIARRFLDKRSFSSLGMKFDAHALPDLFIGFLIPAMLMGPILGAFSLFGWVTWQGWAWETEAISQVGWGLMSGLLGYVMVGFYEELFSRGYQLQNFREGLNLRWGLLLSSAVFALLHIGNPYSSWSSILGILAAGYFLAYGWVRTRKLWLSIGLHIGWNFFEGTIFGFPVSGTQTFRLMQHSIAGPDLVTGGSFGPEAGLIMLPALLVGAVMIREYTKGRLQTASKDTVEPLPDIAKPGRIRPGSPGDDPA